MSLRLGLLVAAFGVAAVAPAQSLTVDRLLQKSTTTLQHLPSLFADSVTASLEKDFSSTTFSPVVVSGDASSLDPVALVLAQAEEPTTSFTPASHLALKRTKALSRSRAKASLFEIANDPSADANPLPSARSFVASAEPVPEPASLAVLGLGALGVMRRRRRK